MSRILITGAAGSIGKELVKKCLKNNQTVCAFDNNEDGLFRLRSELKDAFPNLNHKLRYFLGDIRDLKRLRPCLSFFDKAPKSPLVYRSKRELFDMMLLSKEAIA